MDRALTVDAPGLSGFERLTRDIAVDEAGCAYFERTLPPAQRRYVVFFTPRSGSTWLTEVLASTGRLGSPEEFINPDFVPDIARFLNAKEPGRYLDALLRRRKSPNGVFGMEAMASFVDFIGFDCFCRFFQAEAVFFHLWRENLVAQAVSLYRAVETGHFHSNGGTRALRPGYDADGLERWMSHIAGIENDNVRMLRRLGVPARLLCYEDLVGDRRRVAELFAHALAVPFAAGAFDAAGAGDLVKIGDDWNLESEARFRRERPAVVRRFEAGRLIKTGFGARPARDGGAGEAWSRGLRCGTAGRSPRNNPFEPGSAGWASWRAGWAAGWDTQPYADDAKAAALRG